MTRHHVTPFTPRARRTDRPSLLDLALAAALLVAGAWMTLDLLFHPLAGWGLVLWAPAVGLAVGVGVVLATREARQ